jgi:hypothetical protein
LAAAARLAAAGGLAAAGAVRTAAVERASISSWPTAGPAWLWPGRGRARSLSLREQLLDFVLANLFQSSAIGFPCSSGGR